MKKIVSVITMAAMLAVSSPAMANHRQYDPRWGVDHNWRHRDRGVSTGGAVAIGLGALILGAAIANNNNRNPRVIERYEYPIQRRQPRQVCQDIIQYDYYGDPYVAGRNCWYER